MTHNSHAGAKKRKVNGGWEFKREEEKRIRSMSPLPEAVAIQDLLEQLSDAGSGTDADEASESEAAHAQPNVSQLTEGALAQM